MKTSLITTLTTILSSASVWSQLSEDVGEGRIVGGYPVNPPFKYPWMVAIYRYGEYWCGGTLLTQDTVLTAAHCMVGEKAPLRNFKVQIHRQDLDLSLKAEKGQEFAVTRRIMHPNYNETTLYNDLAIIKLDTKLNSPLDIALDKELTHKESLISTALGWGRIKPTSAPYHLLQEVVLPLYPDTDCVNDYNAARYVGYIKPEIQVCAGFKEGGKDACGGDSGGPLFSEIEGKTTLVGVVSNGAGCAAAGTPGIYTRVGKFRDWILNNMK